MDSSEMVKIIQAEEWALWRRMRQREWEGRQGCATIEERDAWRAADEEYKRHFEQWAAVRNLMDKLEIKEDPEQRIKVIEEFGYKIMLRDIQARRERRQEK